MTDITENLITNISRMLNEIDLAFEDFDSSIIEACEACLAKIKSSKQELQEFCQQTCQDLKDYQSAIINVTVPSRKLKASDYSFLDEIKLFRAPKCIDFCFFTKESKPTKKNLVKYIYQILMSSQVILTQTEGSKTEELQKFLGDLKERVDQASVVAIQNSKVEKSKKKKVISLAKTPEDIFKGLSDNKELMEIASGIAEDLRTRNLDPMTLISSVMSGTQNDDLNEMMASVTQKIEAKIEDGSIQKDLLEAQATEMMKSLNIDQMFVKK
jgi:hypothetical protein